MIRVFLVVIVHFVSDYTHLTQCPKLLVQINPDSIENQATSMITGILQLTFRLHNNEEGFTRSCNHTCSKLIQTWLRFGKIIRRSFSIMLEVY